MGNCAILPRERGHLHAIPNTQHFSASQPSVNFASVATNPSISAPLIPQLQPILQSNDTTANNDPTYDNDNTPAMVLLEEDKRRLLVYGYMPTSTPAAILEQVITVFLDDSFYWKLTHNQLHRLRYSSDDSVVSFASPLFSHRNLHFQLQITKIFKSDDNHGFQLSARLLTKHVIVTTTIALQCIETRCGYHNFVRNFVESGWPSSTLKLSDIDDEWSELNFVCNFDILRIEPMLIAAAAQLPELQPVHDDCPLQQQPPYVFHKPVRMRQKVDLVWSLRDVFAPSYRTDNDDSSLIDFYESPMFEHGTYVVHFIQSNIADRDGFAVMLELFSYPNGIAKITLKWNVNLSYDGKVINRASTDAFTLNESCHSQAFSKSDFQFIGETPTFLLRLLSIKVAIEVIEIYDRYDEVVAWQKQYAVRHWPTYDIFNEEENAIDFVCDDDGGDGGENDEEEDVESLKARMKQMDEKLSELLLMKNKATQDVAIESILTENEDELECNVLKRWLEGEVGLPQYLDMFEKNGFDSLEMMKEINTVGDLYYIGVGIKAHQLKLMNHISKLKEN